MKLLALLIALGILGIGFGLVEARWPAVRDQKRLRSGLLTDVIYWLFTPTAGKLFSGGVVFIGVLALARLFSVPLTGDNLRGVALRDTAISRQPIGLQIVEFLLLADLCGYWQHRAFHTFGRLWRIHAIHHSSAQVDWLSSVRVHPLNDAISNLVVATPLLLLGFQRSILGAYLPFLTLYAIGLHANVSWDFGPLRYVFASPRFHRWHHSAEAAALNKNFAGLLPVYDWLFGTLYLPREVQPTRFGVNDQQVPSGFLSQLVYPLSRQQPPQQVGETA